MNYSYLTENYAGFDRLLSLIFTNVVVTLEGQNLFPLLDLLEEDKVQWVMCFDAGKFTPSPAGDTVVSGIFRESLGEFMGKGKQRA